MMAPATTLVHVTPLLPGQRANYVERLKSLELDATVLERFGVHSLEVFVTPESVPGTDGFVVSRLAADTPDGAVAFLEWNERQDGREIVEEMCATHDHACVADNTPVRVFEARTDGGEQV